MAIQKKTRIKIRRSMALFKKLIAFSAFGILSFVASEIVKADDIESNNTEKIKVGDLVYKISEPDMNRYIVIGTGMGKFKYHLRDEAGHDVYQESGYAKLNNCTGKSSIICVGDTVYENGYSSKISGTVIAINQDVVVFQNKTKNETYSYKNTYLIRKVSGCTNTTPNICEEDTVVGTSYPNLRHGTVKEILSNGKFIYFNKFDNTIYHEANPKDYAKVGAKECTKEPTICVGDTVYESGFSAKTSGTVIAINQDVVVFQNKTKNEIYSYKNTYLIRKVSGCTNTTPNICEEDTVVSISYPNKLYGTVKEILSNGKFIYFNKFDNTIYHEANPKDYAVSIQAALQSGAKPAGVSKPQDIKSFVFSPVNTKNLTQNFLELSMNVHVDANPETWSPSKLMSSLSEDLKSKYNSEMSQVLALYAVSTYVNAMTSELVTTKIKPKYDEAMKELEKAKWSSINQVPAEKQTVDLVIAIVQKTLLTVRAGVSDAELVREIDTVLSGGNALVQPLADIAALESGSFDKLVAFRSFCRTLSDRTIILNKIVNNQNTVAEGKLLLLIIGWMIHPNLSIR